ncbi:MAG: squalene/phytoene synthase family protein [Pseudomonadota bacterium]
MATTYTDAEIEASSGKGSDDENFPVGSFLIKPPLRPHIFAYYAFARASDDIADASHLAPEEKKRRLDAYGAVLKGEAEGLTRPGALARSMAETGVPLERGLDLLEAFKQDADMLRYRSLDDLLAYCRLSANPVGQYLLDLHGEDRGLFVASDALSTSLQILNHLQDCGEDRKNLNRVYIPLDWLEAEGDDIGVLDRAALTPGFRRVVDRLLDVCDELNTTAGALVGGLKSKRLAAESGVVIRLAKRLTARLRKGDPLAERVALTKTDFALAGVGGAWSGFTTSSRKAAA